MKLNKRTISYALLSGLCTGSLYTINNSYLFGLFTLIPVLYGLFLCKDRVTATLAGGVFGVTFKLTSLIWMTNIGYIPWILCSILGTPWLIWGYVCHLFFRSNSSWSTKMIVPSSTWVCLEWILGFFPPLEWNPISTSVTNNLFIQIATFSGSSTLSFLIVFINTCFCVGLLKKEIKSFVIGTTITIGVLFYGEFTIQRYHEKVSAEDIGIQTSSVNYTRDLCERWANFKHETELTKAALNKTSNCICIVWPETAGLPVLNNEVAFNEIEKLKEVCKVPLVISCAVNKNGNWKNQMNIFHNDRIESYSKRILAPFGEFTPKKLQPYLEKFGVGKFEKGDNSGKIFDLGGKKVGGLICLEGIEADLIRKYQNSGVDYIICPSNHSDTGKICSQQQQRMSRLSSVSTSLPLIISDNHGGSIVFNSLGLTFFSTKNRPENYEGVDFIKIPQKGYNTLYNKLGDSVSLLCLILLVTSFYHLNRRKKFC
jgi:apolipoprotein N-acyltransferase